MRQFKMPIKARPFEHQKKAWEFVMEQFNRSEVVPMNISRSNAAALLMEMG
jgi:hypothetical protein